MARAKLDRTCEERRRLETECHTAANRASGLHQINGVPVLPEHRNVALGEKIAYFYDQIHAPRQATGAWKRLAQEEVQEWIGLARG